jgi:hypothetical protein
MRSKCPDDARQYPKTPSILALIAVGLLIVDTILFFKMSKDLEEIKNDLNNKQFGAGNVGKNQQLG